MQSSAYDSQSAPQSSTVIAADALISPGSETKSSRLLLLLCGVPGCGKDTIGRACAERFPLAAALSQDEYGDASRTQASLEKLLSAGRSPILVLRNGIDAGDRLPYVDAARRHGYRVVAVWPSELSGKGESGQRRRGALFLTAVAGCYGRLIDNGKKGHETLTISGGNWHHPAQICLSFFKQFRAPSALGEVDEVLPLPFLREDLSSVGLASSLVAGESDWVDLGKDDTAILDEVAGHVRRPGHKGDGWQGVGLPPVVASSIGDSLAQTQSRLLPFAAMRRTSAVLTEELASFVVTQLSLAASVGPREADCIASSVSQTAPRSPVARPSKDETKRMQRLVKVRSAVEHLVSPANIAGCRATGSTVSSCEWVPIEGGIRPAWPLSYFTGSPQLQRLKVTKDEVLEAVRASDTAIASLQEGELGTRVAAVLRDTECKGNIANFLVAPLDPLPEAALRKLNCPSVDASSVDNVA